RDRGGQPPVAKRDRVGRPLPGLRHGRKPGFSVPVRKPVGARSDPGSSTPRILGRLRCVTKAGTQTRTWSGRHCWVVFPSVTALVVVNVVSVPNRVPALLTATRRTW